MEMMDLSRTGRILGIAIDEWLGFISGGNWESGSKQILHFVQEFRLRARTPAKRLNLLKKTLASTLGVFRKVSRQARLVRARGGEGAWVGCPR
jgi:hypothetical protein